MLPQVAPWQDGVYWISLERDSLLLRVPFRKRGNSLAWYLLRASKSVVQGKWNEAKEEGFVLPLMIHREVLAIPAIVLRTWTWTGWHPGVSGLSLTSNDYNILESGRQNPQRPHHYGQKNRETGKQPDWKKRETISLTLTYRSVQQDQTWRVHVQKRKWSKRTQRNHRKSCGYTERSSPSLQIISFSLAEICQHLATILCSTHSCKMEAQHL